MTVFGLKYLVRIGRTSSTPPPRILRSTPWGMTYLQMLKAMPERNLCLQSTCNSQKLKDKKKKTKTKTNLLQSQDET